MYCIRWRAAPAASRRGRNSTAVGFKCVSLQGVGMLDWAFYESSACSQFRCPNNAISSNEQFFYHPHGPLISVSLIRLNDNNVSYGQAVRFGVVSVDASLSQSSKLLRGPSTPRCVLGSFQEFRTCPQVTVFMTMWFELR